MSNENPKIVNHNLTGDWRALGYALADGVCAALWKWVVFTLMSIAGAILVLEVIKRW